jgi:hypothetical protein
MSDCPVCTVIVTIGPTEITGKNFPPMHCWNCNADWFQQRDGRIALEPLTASEVYLRREHEGERA